MGQTKQTQNFMLSLMVVLLLALIGSVLLPRINCPRQPAGPIICRANLKQLSQLCQIYHQENHPAWPISEWCDTLKPYYEDSEFLQCPEDKTGPCSYAMNENIPADVEKLPDDLVILFEAAPGWNQVGGPDDVVIDRHDKHGANIAFADGRVEFIAAKDIPNLRWKIDDSSVER